MLTRSVSWMPTGSAMVCSQVVGPTQSSFRGFSNILRSLRLFPSGLWLVLTWAALTASARHCTCSCMATPSDCLPAAEHTLEASVALCLLGTQPFCAPFFS